LSQRTVLLIDLGEALNINVHNHLQGIDPAKIYIQSRYNNVYHPKHQKINFINFELIYKNSYEEAFQKLIDFGAYKIANGKTISNLFVDSSQKSLWYYFRFMLLYKYRKTLFEYTVYESVKAKAVDYQKVIFVHQSKAIDKLLNESDHITSIYSAESSKQKKEKLIGVLKFTLLTFSRLLIGFLSIGLLFRSSKKHLFLSNAAASQKVLSMKNYKLEEGDHFSQYLQNFIENKKDFINAAEYFPPSLSKVKELKFRRHFIFPKYKRQLNFETLLYLQFLNPLVYYRAAKDLRKVKLSFSIIKKSESDNYLDQSMLRLMQGFNRLCYFIVFRKAAIRSLLKLFKFKSIISTNEHDAKAKSIMEVAESLGIKTYGIQHGVIHFRHLHYCFSTKDAKHQPFPAITFLWGEYWRKGLLSFSNYAPSNLCVVGQLRTDIIPRLNKLGKEELLSQLLDDRYTVLYPSQPLYVGEEEMRKHLAIDFLKLSKEFPKLQFLVKPHPAEIDCEEFFKKIANEMGATNYKFINDDLYKLLAFSDLVLIYNSTVGTEAIYFQKPLVVMNYSNNDFSGYLKEEIAFEVKNYTELYNKIDLLHKNKLKIDIKAQENFIEERAFKIDGNVAKRIVNYIRGNL